MKDEERMKKTCRMRINKVQRQPKDKSLETKHKSMGTNYCHVFDREVQHGSCSERTEVVPSQLDETQIDKAVKKRRGNESTECLMDPLPEELLHDSLSRLSITELLKAR